jgi:hypothetical protein
MKHTSALFIAIVSLLALFSTPLLAQVNTVPTPLAEKGFKYIGTAGVASVSVGTAGTGYTSIPVVSYTGGGTGHGVVSTSTLKVVGSVTVTAGGTGYADGDILTLVGGTKTTAATFTVAETGGVIDSLTIANAGVYTVPVTTTGAATTTNGSGTGATITVGYGVGTVVVTSAGSGFASAPTVVFTGGAGSSAAATATLNSAATGANAFKFRAITPVTSTVISAISFPTSLDKTGAYYGDADIIGKTLTAGVTYPIYGNSVTLSSGTAVLTLRAAP